MKRKGKENENENSNENNLDQNQARKEGESVVVGARIKICLSLQYCGAVGKKNATEYT